ncbi:Hypothetical protein CINCED_3A016978 [Cinara cedri]|uniref:Haemolymph juvenile hormone binding n=1 Tax=Cinara cedri TaxID=506608 RepID=A0A5E4MFI0_9HEMI|nr:Hypothetical protein CINCED_3A016978 [Cinara cedri]
MKLLAIVAFGLLAARSEAFFGFSGQNANSQFDALESNSDFNSQNNDYTLSQRQSAELQQGNQDTAYNRDNINQKDQKNQPYQQYAQYKQNQQNDQFQQNDQYKQTQQFQQNEKFQQYDQYKQNQQNQQYKQNQQGLNDEYIESKRNVQSSVLSQNQNKQMGQNSQESVDAEDNQWARSDFSGSQNNRNNEEQNYQQTLNKKYQNTPVSEYSSNFNIAESKFSSEIGFQEDYIKEQSGISEVADSIGHNVAQKMVKFFNIVEKYADRDGTVKVQQAREPLNLRHFTLSLPNHKFLNINNSYVNGLNQGIVKEMYFNAESKSVEMKYFFDKLSVNGNVKAGAGQKKSFNLKINNANVNISTELQNRNRNKNNCRSSIENTELNYLNFQQSSSFEDSSINESIKSRYVQFMSRAVESELIENCNNGLVACLKYEIETPFKLPSNYNADLMVANKKSKLSVSFEKTQSWTDEQTTDQRKVDFVGFRKNMNGNGYQLKVKVVLATRPAWKSDVIAKKGPLEVTVRNVKFQAQHIFASAVMERVQQQNGEYKFQVQDAKIELDGLRYDFAKFSESQNENQKFTREVGQNLRRIIENGMSAALQQNLYTQQEICSSGVTNDCARCNQQNAPRL